MLELDFTVGLQPLLGGTTQLSGYLTTCKNYRLGNDGLYKLSYRYDTSIFDCVFGNSVSLIVKSNSITAGNSTYSISLPFSTSPTISFGSADFYSGNYMFVYNHNNSAKAVYRIAGMNYEKSYYGYIFNSRLFIYKQGTLYYSEIGFDNVLIIMNNIDSTNPIEDSYYILNDSGEMMVSKTPTSNIYMGNLKESLVLFDGETLQLIRFTNGNMERKPINTFSDGSIKRVCCIYDNFIVALLGNGEIVIIDENSNVHNTNARLNDSSTITRLIQGFSNDEFYISITESGNEKRYLCKLYKGGIFISEVPDIVCGIVYDKAVVSSAPTEFVVETDWITLDNPTGVRKVILPDINRTEATVQLLVPYSSSPINPFKISSEENHYYFAVGTNRFKLRITNAYKLSKAYIDTDTKGKINYS